MQHSTTSMQLSQKNSKRFWITQKLSEIARQGIGLKQEIEFQCDDKYF